jgi:histidine triad (HIT) family protein
VSDCIFCQIARKEMDAAVVYEDEFVVAFDDIMPQAPVHALVVPKRHHSDLADGVPQETLCALFEAVPKVADAKGVADSGYRVIVNNGRDASQTVGHLHVHVMGGRQMAHGMVRFAEDE